ncbi:hypothetical protein PIROE2DRAFT_15400 [Piromyces sp. E2]|nr:hypothetical protein PIROE2DRAFT_15400 [Piromyces sp. E2]|eukprot:OUM59142.1 hypothetical protein PIROE2DRAFT_15400 [Piromyces sp. E2]
MDIVLIYFGSESDMYFLTLLNEFTFFRVEIDDPYNAAIVDRPESYCIDDSCIFPPVKVVGNPGNYKLRFRLISYGDYSFNKKFL